MAVVELIILAAVTLTAVGPTGVATILIVGVTLAACFSRRSH